MRLGLYQCPSPAGDLDLALNMVDRALGEAAAAGVDLLTMPEVFFPGYNAEILPPPAGYDAALAALPGIVARHKVGLVIGLAEYREKTWNAARVYDRQGAVIARYRKTQLFGPREAALYAAGDALTVFTFEGVRLGLLICYDVEFPEHTRALARAGVEAILTPTANMQPFLNVHHTLVPARALESAVTIVYANYCGEEGDLTYTGRSLIIGPDGLPLGALGDETALLVADLPRGADMGAPLSTQLADYRAVKPPLD